MNGAKKLEASFFFVDESTGRHFDLFDGATIGRNQGDHLFLDDPRMSGKHARFSITGANVFVEDLDSRNGTAINGKKIQPNIPMRVLPGDMIEVGDHILCLGRGTMTPMPKLLTKGDDTDTALLARSSQSNIPSISLHLENEIAAKKAATEKEKPAPAPATDEKQEKHVKSEPKPVPAKRTFAKPEPPTTPLQFDDMTESSPSIAGEPGRPYSLYAMALAIALTCATVSISGVDLIKPLQSDLINWGANIANETLNGDWWRILTSAFLHGGLVQTLANLFAFWSASAALVPVLSGSGTALVFFAAHVSGSILFLRLQPESLSFGSSMGILGLYGAIAASYWRNRAEFRLPSPSTLAMFSLMFIAANLRVTFRSPLDLPVFGASCAVGACFQVFLVSAGGCFTMTRFSRWMRLAISSAFVIALLFSALKLMPKPENHSTKLHAALEGLVPLGEKYDRLKSQVRSSQVPEKDLVNAINSDLLPGIRKIRADLDKIPAFADERQKAVASLHSAFKAWETAWQMQAQGLLHHDHSRLESAAEYEASGFTHLEAAARILEEWKNREVR